MTRSQARRLCSAARNGEAEKVRSLISSRADVTHFDGEWLTPLMHAAKMGHSETVKILLEAGAPWNVISPSNNLSAADLAFHSGHKEAFEILRYAAGVDTVRYWNELNYDCLVQIFAKVGTDSLIKSISLVCKSWYRATFDPQCWTTITFSGVCNSNDFVRGVVRRSQRSAIVVVFDQLFYYFEDEDSIQSEDMLSISEGCPLVKTLVMPQNPLVEDVIANNLQFSELISNWKHLEYFQICGSYHLEEILKSISLQCENFIGFVCNSSVMGNEQVSAIIKFTPKIKFLRMRICELPRECLVMLLKECTALETLDVKGCIGFAEGDDEIIKLASHINSFHCIGATLYDRDYFCYDYYSTDTDNLPFWPK